LIVLHESKIIALKARKVGGTSFEIALSKFASAGSIITPITKPDEEIRKALGFRGPQNYKYSASDLRLWSKQQLITAIFDRKLPDKFYAHISAAEAQSLLGHDQWSSYTKVAIIRNPFDSMVSSYFWDVKSPEGRARVSFENYVLSRPEVIQWNNHVYKIKGDDVLDAVIRYEHLREDLEALERHHPLLCGLAETFSTISAKSQWRPSSANTEEMFAEAPRALNVIRSICLDEIYRYGFSVPGMS